MALTYPGWPAIEEYVMDMDVVELLGLAGVITLYGAVAAGAVLFFERLTKAGASGRRRIAVAVFAWAFGMGIWGAILAGFLGPQAGVFGLIVAFAGACADVRRRVRYERGRENSPLSSS